MRRYRTGIAAVAAIVAAGLASAPAWAADPAPVVPPGAAPADPASVQAPIKGVDVMGDKGRTGPDGWAIAPQTRDQAPADTGNQTAANGRGALNSQPNPDAGRRLAPGDDPGTPAATDAHGPGTIDSGAARKP